MLCAYRSFYSWKSSFEMYTKAFCVRINLHLLQKQEKRKIFLNILRQFGSKTNFILRLEMNYFNMCTLYNRLNPSFIFIFNFYFEFFTLFSFLTQHEAYRINVNISLPAMNHKINMNIFKSFPIDTNPLVSLNAEAKLNKTWEMSFREFLLCRWSYVQVALVECRRHTYNVSLKT